MKLNIKNLITGTPTRMRYVHRFSTSRTLIPENVAEHSYFVCLYSYTIAWWAIENSDHNWISTNHTRFIAEVMGKAVLHDLEESRSGDIHRPFKMSSPELSAALGHAAEVAFKQCAKDFLGDEQSRDDFFNTWFHAKDDISGAVVAFADFLSVVSFVVQEGKDVLRSLCLDTLPKHYNSFLKPEYNFIRPLVDQVAPIMEELFNGEREVSTIA